jgi:hypothetical protein
MDRRYGIKIGRTLYTFPIAGGLPFKVALKVARDNIKYEHAKQVGIVRLFGDRRRVLTIKTPKPEQTVKSETWWTIKCAQSASGTTAVWYQTDPRNLRTKPTGSMGGPGVPFDPGYGAMVKVTFEIVRPGKAYPANPYAPKRPRRKPTRIKRVK